MDNLKKLYEIAKADYGDTSTFEEFVEAEYQAYKLDGNGTFEEWINTALEEEQIIRNSGH